MAPSLPLLAAATLLTTTGPAVLTAPPSAPARPAVATGTAEHQAAPGAAERRRVLRYWTPRRMAAALPAAPLAASLPALRAPAGKSTAGAVWTGRGAAGSVGRTTGRVFLTMAGGDFVCSASTVRSASRDLVVTAGHCLKDGTGEWADNWIFVPGYRDGGGPYGSFTARRMFVPRQWSQRGDDSHDVGMVALNPRRGRHVADVTGVQEIAFNVRRGGAAHIFGFPADPPYDGRRLVYCAGRPRPDPHGQTHDQGLPCDMTAGASGGPWLAGFDARTGRGTLTSVSSFKYTDDETVMYGPYLGAAAKDLYARAQRA
ncbi:hypothetical protein DP939_40570 [Spongiactinospora rosea]|uniref:V8-like Glu-specific endopeptidase n=1 Tax=Spongiactinospora rosea TaxID=2248750 RepID=A0A366LKG5_9ACTN|nr:hypothetical protein [Spongiactinospora rosea]RBQ14408.1 hypothetical protein DP939_40570 [Spongiactinospora rosea]